MQVFQWWGFFHAGWQGTCHVCNQCWGDISGSKVLKSDYRWLQWFQGMAVPSGGAGPGCAGAFSDSVEFSWPCLAETRRTQGHHLVQNKAFPRLFHTMPSAHSFHRKMHVQGWHWSREPRFIPWTFYSAFLNKKWFSLTSSISFLPGCHSCIPQNPDPVPLLSTTLSPANTCLLPPKEPPSENNPASINPSL